MKQPVEYKKLNKRAPMTYKNEKNGSCDVNEKRNKMAPCDVISLGRLCMAFTPEIKMTISVAIQNDVTKRDSRAIYESAYDGSGTTHLAH